jgi:NAD(P)-dependent dehydrogenase (short-subunit alcohol dehydrogenase family)
MNRSFSACLATALLLSSTFVPSTGHAQGSAEAILVTGASSGLGRAIAEDLASRGYFVYAGARKDKDLAELDQIENVQAIRLDVNVQADIDAAVEEITSAGRGLYGLVNNAGVAVFGPLIEIDEEDFDFQMNVNVYGVYRITKAFAPLIMNSKGRITTIGSISGTLASAIWGPYSMSKHAIEAFVDALADEMRCFDVQVSIIEPGTYKSNITQSMFARMEAQGQHAEDSLFEEEFEANMTWAKRVLAVSGDPAEVAEAAYLALFEENPKQRYLIVPDQGQAESTIRKMIQRTVQMNERHRFTYSRDDLVSMLDEALANTQQ